VIVEDCDVGRNEALLDEESEDDSSFGAKIETGQSPTVCLGRGRSTAMIQLEVDESMIDADELGVKIFMIVHEIGHDARLNLIIKLSPVVVTVVDVDFN
jgi:hypothetical protein